MASEYPFDPACAGDGAASAAPIDELRRRLRVRLERHLLTEAFRPALTIVGFRGANTDVLRHGVDQPEDAVLEFVLPAKYSALGVLASSIVATPPHRNHQDAALAVAVNRDGDVVSLLATHDGVTNTSSPQGWLVDACLRSLGLATAATAVVPLAFPVALWLDRLMVAILNTASAEQVTWGDAVDLCPVPRRWRSIDPIDLGTTMGSTTRSWKALRLAAAQGEESVIGIRPERAQWMDDPMFARWCMGSFPDLSSLRGDVEFLAPAEVAEQVELTLRAAWLAFSG